MGEGQREGGRLDDAGAGGDVDGGDMEVALAGVEELEVAAIRSSDADVAEGQGGRRDRELRDSARAVEVDRNDGVVGVVAVDLKGGRLEPDGGRLEADGDSEDGV